MEALARSIHVLAEEINSERLSGLILAALFETRGKQLLSQVKQEGKTE
jgi:hypothetical protein